MAINKIKIKPALGPRPPKLTGEKLTLAGVMRAGLALPKKPKK